MKKDSDNFRQSSILGVMERLNDAGVEMVVYEPLLNEKTFIGAKVIDNLEAFKTKSDVIVCNRFSDELLDVAEKVYTRDLWRTDE